MSIYIAQKQNKKGWRFGFVKIILDFNMDDSLFLMGSGLGASSLKLIVEDLGNKLLASLL
jgi:hypothetical protein